MRAVAAGHDECVRLLLAAGARPDTIAGPTEPTPLIQALLDKDLVLVRVLLQDGAEVEAATSDGWTPLMYAVRSGRPDLVTELLEAGANPEATTRWGSAGRSVVQIAERALVERQRPARLLEGTQSKALTSALRSERDAMRIIRLLQERIAARTRAREEFA